MKKLLGFAALALLLIPGFSCKKEKVDELTEFDINYSTSIAIPSNTMEVNAAPVDFTTPDIPTQSSSKFTENKTAQDLVDQVKLTKFNISVANGNLDFLKSISIYIKSAGMNEALVASKTTVPSGLTTLALDLQDVNIRDYIFKQNIQFRVNVAIDASTLSGQNLKMDETVHVKATILN